ncbi:Putative ubiquitin-like-specific protease 1B [Arachis hypogaea]|nr:Putative ubiquitin-like-specific protease 1B [Arachis hypogaea]
MLQQAMSGKDGLPMVGSNSPYIIWSRNRGTTTTEPLNKPDTTGLRTYKQRKTRTKNNRNDDPDYDPKLNHITNSDDGSFKFSRGKGKKKVSFKTAMSKSSPRGRRNLFPASMSSRGCHGPKSSYVMNTTVKIARARNLQQKFMLHRNLDSSFMAGDIGKTIPKGMPVSFQPTLDMEIEGLHLAIAAYIFNTKLDQEEMLVSNPHCAMTQKALRTLEPGKQIVDDVLILLARMLAFDSTRLQWYLPTTFVQIATGRGPIPEATISAIRKDFMGYADDVLKIYCPMWCDNHWFLVIVDLSQKQLVYLGSLRSPTARSKRRRQIQKLAIFLDDLLDDCAWYANADTDKIECNEFDIKEPEVAQQLPESNDCGVFVAQWMIMYHLFYDYDIEAFQFVTDYRRMRLAIDMVLKYHNDNRMETVEAALNYWRSFTIAPW